MTSLQVTESTPRYVIELERAEYTVILGFADDFGSAMRTASELANRLGEGVLVRVRSSVSIKKGDRTLARPPLA